MFQVSKAYLKEVRSNLQVLFDNDHSGYRCWQALSFKSLAQGPFVVVRQAPIAAPAVIVCEDRMPESLVHIGVSQASHSRLRLPEPPKFLDHILRLLWTIPSTATLPQFSATGSVIQRRHII